MKEGVGSGGGFVAAGVSLESRSERVSGKKTGEVNRTSLFILWEEEEGFQDNKED